MTTAAQRLPELHPGDPVQKIGAHLDIVRQTEKAVLVRAIGAESNPCVWLPKSQVWITGTADFRKDATVVMPSWLYRKVRPQLTGESL